MPILKNRCPSALLCNSSECEHKHEHEKNDFCQAGWCRWSKGVACVSDLKGYIDSVLCDYQFACERRFAGRSENADIKHEEVLDLIMAAIKEEYEA